jgi:hypothetical protein
MFFHYLGIHQYIININDHELIQLFIENKVHEGCECRRNIAQPKWHHQELVGAIPGPHCHFFYIFIRNANLIVPQLEINLVEVLGPIELIQHIINVRQMINFLLLFYSRHDSQCTFSTCHPFYPQKKKKRPIWRLVLSNIPSTKEVV